MDARKQNPEEGHAMDQLYFRITWADGTYQDEFGANENDIRQFCARSYPGKEISYINEI